MSSKEKLKLTLGCDPEVGLLDYHTGAWLIACDKIGGTKQEPLRITPHTCIQEDGVAVEFNVEPVEYAGDEETESVLWDSAHKGFLDCLAFVKAKDASYSLGMTAEVHFGQDALAANPKSMVMGCEPDLDAHQMGVERPIFFAEQLKGNRFFGGHIHFGYDKSKCEVPEWAIVQMLNSLVDIPACWYISQEVIGSARMSFYGNPGGYRIKPYGFEHRTLSGYWLLDGAKEIPRQASFLVDWIINHPNEARGVYDALNFRADIHGIKNRYMLPGGLRAAENDRVYEQQLRYLHEVMGYRDFDHEIIQQMAPDEVILDPPDDIEDDFEQEAANDIDFDEGPEIDDLVNIDLNVIERFEGIANEVGIRGRF